MKKYFNIILITSFLLLIFPFLALPELWENIYVAVLAFIIGYSSMLLRHKIGISGKEEDETSLQNYVHELKERFRNGGAEDNTEQNPKRVSDIYLDEK